MNELGTTEKELIRNRIEKLEKLVRSGISPYPSASERNHMANDVHVNMDELISSKKEVTIAGRITAKRGHGQLVFFDVVDESGKLQAVFRSDIVGEEFSLLNDIDPGDFIQVSGKVFITKSGELSVEAHNFKLLTKSLRPLPEKWHGIKDEELRFRKRYLEFITNPEAKELFYRKAKFWQATRDFLIHKGFLEVETPALETTAGGADANPFITYHNAFDMPVYLRISMGELWQKRLMVAGFEKTFEIGRQFRNEGLSREHLQDYTQMEFYWAYANYEDSMKLVREMYIDIAKKTFGTTKFQINGFDIELDQEWPEIDYSTIISEKEGIDILSATDDEIRAKLKESGIKFDPTDQKGRLVDLLWKKIRKSVAGPAFLVNHPVEVSPLAKKKADDPSLVERYQVMIAGSELGNGYSELNDPVDQNKRFEEQAKLRATGDTEAQMHDRDFVAALEYGMPPTTGFGFSERLFAFLADKPVREAQFFPLMKPESKLAEFTKEKETKLAVVLLNKEANLLPWQEKNAVAHLCASFAGREGKSLFLQDKILTKDDEVLSLNIQSAILVKEVLSNKELRELIKESKLKEIEVVEFIRPMVETSSDKKIIEDTRSKNFDEIELLGILLYGQKQKVEALTKEFKLAE